MRDEPTHIPSTWTRVCGIEIGRGHINVIWAAHARMTDVLTLYDEYTTTLGPLAIHAEAIKARGRWIPVLIDIGAAGAQARPGRIAMAQQLAHLDVNLIADVPIDPEVAVVEMLGRAETGRLKVWTTLPAWLAEYRTYCRNENGDLPEGFGLMRATGLVIAGLSAAISENRAASDEEGDDGCGRPNNGRNPTTGY